MDTDIIYPIIRRNNRNWLIFLVIAFAIICIAIFQSLNALDNALHGPYEVTQEDVTRIKDLNAIKHYYITVVGDRVADSGFQYVSDSNKVEKSYMLLRLNKKLLLVELMGGPSKDIEYTGTLIPFGSEIEREVIKPLIKEYPELETTILPFMLKTYDFVVPTVLAMGILALLGLICLWRITIVVQRISDTSRHPIIRSLSRFGEPDTLVSQIEQELTHEHLRVGKTIHLTDHWLIQSTSSSLKATPLTDIMWIYKQVIQHRTYGIPVGKTYAALIYDRAGKKISVAGKEGFVTEVLTSVALHAPWVVMGYTTELKNRWKKDRPRFITEVDKRKQQSK